ncbi:hypothetical protein J1605_015533 [Eschrichtius robustus]|uniref:Uncharacterized protein n=1 Tax=Eschrichtius robustus TaxID=9764 RepID=A0AB34G9C6_ESCRO|nr:hypothetical protein J1605_015533 [Eschrichtius robustus]
MAPTRSPQGRSGQGALGAEMARRLQIAAHTLCATRSATFAGVQRVSAQHLEPSRIQHRDLVKQATFSLTQTSLVVQWLRIRLPMQGTRVRSLVREDPTCRGATKPVCHNS